MFVGDQAQTRRKKVRIKKMGSSCSIWRNASFTSKQPSTASYSAVSGGPFFCHPFHLERWSPRGSWTRRRRQTRSVRGNGSRRRRSKRMRKMLSGYVTSEVYAMVAKALLANGPVCESSIAWLAGSNLWYNPVLAAVLRGRETCCCQPGCMGPAKASVWLCGCQVGGSHPCSAMAWRVSRAACTCGGAPPDGQWQVCPRHRVNRQLAGLRELCGAARHF